jgi:peptidoglycan/xylan/chitin deacetylase (PgdA/CDA1 family)
MAYEIFSHQAGSGALMISLLYHDVVEPHDLSSSGFGGGDADIYKLTRTEFELHLEMLDRASGRGEVAVLDSVARQLSGKSLLLTFDDGGASAVVVASLLEQRGWRGHFFITTDYIGKPGFVTADQIRDLHRRGHVIGSHSCSHPTRMSHCTEAELKREWMASSQILSETLGEKLRVASVPGGFYSRRVAESAAEAGIEVLFNSEPTVRTAQVNGCLVLGRYSVQQGVSARRVVSIAQGTWLPRFQQYLFWNAKTIAKRLGGSHYLALRKSLLKDPGSMR